MAHVIRTRSSAKYGLYYTRQEIYISRRAFSNTLYVTLRVENTVGWVIIFSLFFLSDMSRISSYRRRELTAHFEWIAAQSIEFIQTTPFTFSDLFFWMKNKKQKSYNRSSGRERTTKICFCVCVSGDDVYPTAA